MASNPHVAPPRAHWSLGQPGPSHRAHTTLLDGAEAPPRVAWPGAARLDLDEDQRPDVAHDEVELAETGPVVASDEREAQALQVS